MKEVIMTLGTYIEYEITKKSIIFGDDDLAINLNNREKDEKVLIDICSDANGELTMGVAVGLNYIAQVEIPARQYIEEEQDNPKYDPEAEEGTEEAREKIITRTAVPFDIENCTIYLWGMEE